MAMPDDEDVEWQQLVAADHDAGCVARPGAALPCQACADHCSGEWHSDKRSCD